MTDVSAFAAAFNSLRKGADRPDLMLVSPPVVGAMEAGIKFAGRDRRRIKREIRKAWRKARLEDRAFTGPISREPLSFWRNAQ